MYKIMCVKCTIANPLMRTHVRPDYNVLINEMSWFQWVLIIMYMWKLSSLWRISRFMLSCYTLRLHIYLHWACTGLCSNETKSVLRHTSTAMCRGVRPSLSNRLTSASLYVNRANRRSLASFRLPGDWWMMEWMGALPNVTSISLTWDVR